jgi:hypothetical protein
VESASVGVGAVAADPALEGVGKPDSGKKKRRLGQEEQE